MSAVKHAPGPWVYGHNVSHSPTVRSADPGRDNGGFIVAEFFGLKAHDNARLTAAAPEMLAALQAAIPWMAKAIAHDVFAGCAEPMVALRTIERMQAAIAKATGA